MTIRRALERTWRVPAVGLLFAVFGLGAVVIAGVVLPVVVRVRRRQRAAVDLTAQRLVQRSCALFVRFGTLLGIFDLRQRGLERLANEPGLVVANHPSLLDVVFLLAFMPQGDCVVKREAWHNPALRGVVAATGYIPSEAGPELVEACVKRLAAGRSIILFPEGSRSPETGLRTFKRGVAHIALRSGCRILPVVIECDPPALKKGQAWYAFPGELLKYRFTSGEAMYAKDLVGGDVDSPLAARRLTAALRSYFAARLGDGTA